MNEGSAGTMRRDKYRFRRLFHRLQWWRTYYWEYGSSHCGTYEDGYYCEHTPEQHEAMLRRQDRAATQFANEVCGKKEANRE